MTYYATIKKSQKVEVVVVESNSVHLLKCCSWEPCYIRYYTSEGSMKISPGCVTAVPTRTMKSLQAQAVSGDVQN